MVLLGTLVLSALTLAALKLGTDEARAARATRVSASALYAAETGIHATELAWPTTRMTRVAPGDSICLDGDCSTGWTSLTNGSRYRRVMHRRDAGTNATNRIFSLTSEGRTYGPLGGAATTQTWVTFRPAILARFSAAISSVGFINMGGQPGSYTDSYDSRLGGYNATLADGTTNLSNDGDVISGGSLSLSGSAEVRGDASVNSYSSSGSGTVTGTLETGAEPPDHPVEECPPQTTSLSPTTSAYKNGSFSLGGGTYTFQSGTYSMDQFVTGGTSQVIIPDGASVTIYLSGKLDMAGSSTINNVGRNPSALNFISCYEVSTDKQGKSVTTYNGSAWFLNGFSAAYATLYQPTGKVTLGGASPLYGAVVAGMFDAGGGAPVHFDLALKGDTPPETVVKVSSRSWSQLLY
jgi:hypothetical protein